MKEKIKELTFECLQIIEACGIKNRELDQRLWKIHNLSKELSSTKQPHKSEPSDEIQVIEYEGFLYWYKHKLAKDRVDICLGTKDPKKYCNGFYLYSTKDTGSGKEFVVIGTNNPDFYKEWMRNNNPVEYPQVEDEERELEQIKQQLSSTKSEPSRENIISFLSKMLHIKREKIQRQVMISVEGERLIDLIRNNYQQPQVEDEERELDRCVYCKINSKSEGSEYCGQCIDEGKYINTNK